MSHVIAGSTTMAMTHFDFDFAWMYGTVRFLVGSWRVESTLVLAHALIENALIESKAVLPGFGTLIHCNRTQINALSSSTIMMVTVCVLILINVG